MANEYLKRTPTSTGNAKVFTWSGWVKRNALGSFQGIFSATSRVLLVFTDQDKLRIGTQSVDYEISSATFRDVGSWMHILLAIDTTLSSGRYKVYVNGITVLSGVTNLSINADVGPTTSATTNFDYAYSAGNIVEGEAFDVFFIDGQALTPEVFGFYKDGNGYISAGSTQATDFRNGQWVPRTPREIKNLINDNGGFGVNGFYLPMNDSSNFGADFHTTPNSIITLKGENLPQPRNGAPTTTDAYVSQLRSDPYAANLVLAVPGISTATGSNLITNGNFDNNTAGWTGGNGTISWTAGQLLVTSGGSGNGYAYQSFTTVIGERYSVKFNYTTGTGGLSLVWIGTTAGGGEVLQRGDILTSGTYNVSFTATATTTFIRLGANTPTASLTYYYDNVVVKQEDAPRDYSADIKGSGTNKTPTLSGNSGVGYEIPGYYGSVYTSSSNNDYLEFPGTSGDFNVGTGDFTIEMWLNPNSTQTANARLFGQDGNSAGNWDVYINNTSASNRIYMMGGGVSLTGGDGSSYGNLVGDQWNHFCLERYNGQLTTYMNGVSVYTQSYTSSIGDSNPFRIGQIGSNVYGGVGYGFNGEIQDFRFYKGVAKYKGGFDVPKPYTPVGISTWRAVSDTCQNNFATLNPLSYQTTGTPGTSYPVLSDGNLRFTHGQDGQWERSNATMGVSEGKYYFEYEIVKRPSTLNDSTQNWAVGLRESDSSTFYQCTDAYEDLGDHIYWIDGGNGPKIVSNQDRSRGYTYGVERAYDGDIINIAFEKTSTTLKAWFGLNGTYFNNGDPTNGTNPAVNHSTTTQFVIPSASFYTYPGYPEPVGVMNFGQNPTFSGTKTAETYTDSNGKGLFKYQPPEGFLALCEDNLSTPAIKDPGEYFKTVLYTGDGNSGRSITGVGFQPDLVWGKSRTTTHFHTLQDSVRGAGFSLYANSTAAEEATTGMIQSFNSDGFTVGSTGNALNNDGENYVAWCWKAGGPAVTNTDGTITSQVSANQTAGFSIVSYTGNGTVGATVGHGLGKKPKFFMTKNRDTSPLDWPVFSEELLGSNGYIYLNLTNPAATTSGISGPTSSVLTLSGYNDNNKSGDRFIAYCWAEIEGFSKFGSYVGNANADGPFVYCGFKPAWVMVKRVTTGANEPWAIYDSSRGSTNPNPKGLYADDLIENDASGRYKDFLSNGFKVRGTSGEQNSDGITYIFAAFAESPFQTANAK